MPYTLARFALSVNYPTQVWAWRRRPLRSIGAGGVVSISVIRRPGFQGTVLLLSSEPYQISSNSAVSGVVNA
jgi:hypothetical protein